MNRVFADTYFLLGLTNRRDEAHPRCAQFNREFDGRFVTTSYVLVEVGDALSAPSDRANGAEFISFLRQDSRFEVVPASESLLSQGLDLFRSRSDKEWSLTDCLSFVVMNDEKLSAAATGDHHFEQAGFEALLR